MKTRIALSTLVALTLMASLCACASAAAEVQIYGYTAKAQYQSGEEGQLKIWIMNEGDEDLIFQNISVIYPWNYLLPGGGNETLTGEGQLVLKHSNITYEFDFTIPSDGRSLVSGDIFVRVETDKDTDTASIPINIANPPVNMRAENMDNLVTLFTVQIVIAIVAALIIAAAVFLSGRRSGVTWQKET